MTIQNSIENKIKEYQSKIDEYANLFKSEEDAYSYIFSKIKNWTDEIIRLNSMKYLDLVIPTYHAMVKDKNSDGALVYLYDAIIEHSKDLDKCSEFIKNLDIKNLDSNAIVHIFNALSSIKDQLSNWKEVIDSVEEVFISKFGKDYSYKLMKALV